MGRRLLRAALLLAAAAGRAAASPPDGRPPKDAREAFAKADAVFTGQVREVREDALGRRSLALVDVEYALKGFEGLAPAVWVDGSGGPTRPARLFKPGQHLLFYAGLPSTDENVPEGEVAVRAGSWNRVVPVESSGAEIVRHKGKARMWRDDAGLFRVPRWERCAADRDCSAVPALCGDWATVNRASAKSAAGYFQRRNMVIDCPRKNLPEPDPVCRKARCVPRPEE